MARLTCSGEPGRLWAVRRWPRGTHTRQQSPASGRRNLDQQQACEAGAEAHAIALDVLRDLPPTLADPRCTAGRRTELSVYVASAS